MTGQQLEKLVAKFLSKPPDVSFQEVAKLLEAFGYEERPSKGSHRYFIKRGHPSVSVPTVKGRRVKRCYVKRITEILELEEWYEQQHGT